VINAPLPSASGLMAGGARNMGKEARKGGLEGQETGQKKQMG